MRELPFSGEEILETNLDSHGEAAIRYFLSWQRASTIRQTHIGARLDVLRNVHVIREIVGRCEHVAGPHAVLEGVLLDLQPRGELSFTFLRRRTLP